MAPETPKRVRMWSFPQAPAELQALFPEATDSDWVVHAPAADRDAIESSLLQWRPVYPVRSAEQADGSVVYLGTPHEAVNQIANRGTLITGPLPAGHERRTAVRVRMECPSRYQTPQQAGFGHTVDMSSTGIAFTTETMLAPGSPVTLHVTWPVGLEGGVPVEFYAVGKLARAEAMKAAMHMDRMGFSIEN